MNKSKKIVKGLLLVNGLQLAVGLCTWGYVGKVSLETSEYVAFVAMGLMLVSCMVTLAGLYVTMRSQDNRLEENIRNLEEFNTTLRAQRHDYMNHFQVIFGLMELEEYEEARKYLEPVFKDTMKTGRALKTAQPAVNALLQAKLKAAEEKGIEVYLEISTDLKRLPLEAWNLCKVLANIIDNGIRALAETQECSTKCRTKELRIQISQEQEKYYFSIANNGPAIPAEVQKMIFRQGFSTKQEEGHGMGLYIAREIVKEAGGYIDLQSDESRTVFHVVMPCAARETMCVVSRKKSDN